jgi:hypothetical protein
MTDEDVIAKVADLFGVAYNGSRPKKRKWKYTWRVTLRGERAVGMMRQLRPWMGCRRQAQIDAAVQSFKFDPNYWTRRSMPDRAELTALHGQGMSCRAIARKMNVSHSWVAKVVNSAL